MKYLLAAIFTSLLVLATACSQAPPPTKSASDGIQVHGHWTVTVTNPDGTVDAVHEFDNAFTDFGSLVLQRLLTGDVLLGTEKKLLVDGQLVEQPGWVIDMIGEPPSESEYLDHAVDCQEEVQKDTYAGRVRLIPSLVKDGLDIDLSATCFVTKGEALGPIPSAIITEVNTGIYQKCVTFNCAGGYTTMDFTNHVLEEAIEVKKNQTLAFNITISFGN